MNYQDKINNKFECYAPIVGYDNYAISTFGNVLNIDTQRILKPMKTVNGYLSVGLYKDGKCIYKNIHRLVAETFLKRDDACDEVDHIDCNKANNHIINLRWASRQQNLCNRQIGKNNASGFKGVSKGGKKWRARIAINGTHFYLGAFETKEEAAIAYNEKARELFGLFARLNIIPQ